MGDKGYGSLEELSEYDRIVNHTCRSENEFYEFYNAYVREKGFNIRRHRRRLRAGTDELIWRSFCCSREGYRSMDWFERNDRQREPGALSRCGCLAKLEVQLSEKTGEWFVCNFVDGHNHELAKREHTHVLRSHRSLKDPQKAEVIELGLGELRTSQIMDVMEKIHGGPEDTGFLLMDLYKFFSRHKKQRIEGFDAACVMNHFKVMSRSTWSFFTSMNWMTKAALQICSDLILNRR